MSKKVKIDKVVLTIGGKEIALSLEEAQELKGILNETFGGPVVERQIIRDRWVYPWWEYRPYHYNTETILTSGTTAINANWTVGYSSDSNALALSVG